MHLILYRIYSISILLFLLQGCIRSDTDLMELRIDNGADDWNQILEIAPDLENHALTFDEIINFVLERNIELLVKRMEFEYQYELATGSTLKMIPPLVLTGELSNRDKNTGSSSQSLIPSIPPAPPSISSQRRVNRYDITFTWNLLDFGISYFRARQTADKTIIQEMEYFHVRQRLIQDTIDQYWKARTALLGITKSRHLIEQAGEILAFMNQQIQNQIIPRDKGLFLERQIQRQEVQIQFFEREYHTAISELGKLMGSPFPNFTLVQEDIPQVEIDLPAPDVLEQLALLNRPELYGLDMEEKNMISEARIAFIQIFPSLAPFIGDFFDSNFFLIYHHWIYGGLRYTWNLLAIPAHLQDYSSEEKHAKIKRFERIGASVGILAQVNLAWISYHDAKREYRLMRQLANQNRELLETSQMREQYGETSYASVFADYSYDAFLSEVEAFRAYGYLQTTIAQINTSIGIPFYLSSQPQLCEENE